LRCGAATHADQAGDLFSFQHAEANGMHKTSTNHAHNRMHTPEQEQPNACRTHATSMQKACTLQEQAQEARARIPRIPRSRHTPQDAGFTELTHAGVTVDGERPALVPWRPEVRATGWLTGWPKKTPPPLPPPPPPPESPKRHGHGSTPRPNASGCSYCDRPLSRRAAVRR
jgi:hypothetical protein